MAWWGGPRKHTRGYGTHQERKEGAKHKRHNIEREMLELEYSAGCEICGKDAVRFGMCSRCVTEIYGQEP